MTPHPSFQGLGQTQRFVLVELDLCRGSWFTIQELQAQLRHVEAFDISINHLRSVVRSLEKRKLVEIRPNLDFKIAPRQNIITRCTSLGHQIGFNGDLDVLEPPRRQ